MERTHLQRPTIHIRVNLSVHSRWCNIHLKPLSDLGALCLLLSWSFCKSIHSKLWNFFSCSIYVELRILGATLAGDCMEKLKNGNLALALQNLRLWAPAPFPSCSFSQCHYQIRFKWNCLQLKEHCSDANMCFKAYKRSVEYEKMLIVPSSNGNIHEEVQCNFTLAQVPDVSSYCRSGLQRALPIKHFQKVVFQQKMRFNSISPLKKYDWLL